MWKRSLRDRSSTSSSSNNASGEGDREIMTPSEAGLREYVRPMRVPGVEPTWGTGRALTLVRASMKKAMMARSMERDDDDLTKNMMAL